MRSEAQFREKIECKVRLLVVNDRGEMRKKKDV